MFTTVTNVPQRLLPIITALVNLNGKSEASPNMLKVEILGNSEKKQLI